jgi:hypothetical protein
MVFPSSYSGVALTNRLVKIHARSPPILTNWLVRFIYIIILISSIEERRTLGRKEKRGGPEKGTIRARDIPESGIRGRGDGDGFSWVYLGSRIFNNGRYVFLPGPP